MRTAIIFLAFFCLTVSQTFAQTTVRGVVRDSLQREHMADIVVVLMNSKDSMLVNATRTNTNGHFELQADTGSYIVLVSSADYADYTDVIHITGQAALDLGNINMITRSRLLQEVVVKGAVAAISIKGDTTEFVADSFHLQHGASVEELLKRLPGLNVDKDGKITAQGEAVKKVLVDGEEFFGDDPTLVTRNLHADIIDKVQIYDKKSDLATVTGINDGIKDKTINLKLKEEGKKGSFGKVVAGGGLQGYYENQAMFNLFKNKRKVSVFGTWANTGRVGLGAQDDEKYSTGKNESVTKDNELDTWNGAYDGQGIPVARTGGAHFNDKWNEDRQSINLNYRVAGLTVEGENNTITQNNLPGEIIISHTSQTFANNSTRNRLTGEYEIRPDSSLSIKLNVAGGLQHTTTENFYITNTLRADSVLLNNGERHLNSAGDLHNMNTNILMVKQLRKKGRSISLHLHNNYIDESNRGFISSTNHFHIASGDSAATVNQYKADLSRSLYLDGKVVFTAPLSRSMVMLLNYSFFANSSQSDLATYNKAGNGKYEEIDSALSSRYQFDQRIHQGGVAFSYDHNKIHLNYGLDMGYANLLQQHKSTGATLSRNFVNWYPTAEIAYVIRLQKSVGIYYKGNNQMPTVNQLLPVPNVNDPLNVYIGNPALRPSFSHVLGVKYNSYKTAAQQYLFSNFNYAFSNNQIAINTLTDTAGKNVYSYANVGGSSNYWGYLGIGKKMQQLDMNAGLNVNINGGRGVNYSNHIKNVLSYSRYGVEAYANKYREKWFDASLKLSASYNTNRSSLQESASVNYWLYMIGPDLTLFLPAGFKIHTDFSYQHRQRTTLFTDNLDVLLWNAWLEKRLIRDGSLLVRLSANDLLNQNRGFSRSVANNFIIQNSYTTIQRFFLLSVSWNFVHNNDLNSNK
ncbi:outer membrane beta-barrel protein [Chitinophaga vietnamensis]|uniref:outer membrane beta-barrel protein n=1 Tax=Chitinophaga vietnamensis TaxID=2593957 RepID=UPI0011782410|nr:outer membrane beta-barrel protein [Chitinophaga vietnamensis]